MDRLFGEEFKWNLGESRHTTRNSLLPTFVNSGSKNESKRTPQHNNQHHHHNQPVSAFIQPAIPKYLSNYGDIYDAVLQIKDHIKNQIITHNKDHSQCAQIIAAFGYAHSGDETMPPQLHTISRQFAEYIHGQLTSYQQWVHTTNWTERHIFHTPQGITVTTHFEVVTGENGGKNKLRIEYGTDTHKVQNHFKYVNSKSPCAMYDIHFSVLQQNPVQPTALPTIVNPTQVCIESRKTFTYSSAVTPAQRPTWRYTLLRRWIGASKSEAEFRQKTGEPLYGFELECLDPESLMIDDAHDEYYVACSLFLKMRDMLPVAASSFRWEPAQIQPQSEMQVECF